MTQFPLHSPRPAWVSFGKQVLRRMISDQINAGGKRDAALQDHPKSRLLDTLNDLPRAQHRDSEELDQLRETGIDGWALDDQGRSRPATVLPASRSLIALRLAATFISSRNVMDTLLVPGAVTLLTGLRTAEADFILGACRSGLLPEAWKVTTLGDERHHEQTLRVLQVTTSTGTSRTGDLYRLERNLCEALQQPCPLLVLLPDGESLPDNLNTVLPNPVKLEPLSRDILITQLEHSHSATSKIDREAVEPALPDDDALSQLGDPDVLLALRAPDARSAAERLAAAVSRTRRHAGGAGALTLKDIGGTSPAHQAAADLVADLRSWQRGELKWSAMSRSLLIYGEPGTGKTVLAGAIAASAGVPLVQGSFGAWQARGHLGDMLAAMLTCFQDAKSRKPCVLFIDEIDSCGSRADTGDRNQAYRQQVINEFLRQIDLLHKEEGILLIGATNFPGKIDPAILRPGRFDLHHEMPLPSRQQIQAILEQAFPDSGQDLRPLSRNLTGQTPALIDAKIRDARAKARRQGRSFDPRFLEQVLGQEQGYRSQLDERIAVHECGHVISAWLYGEEVKRVCLSPTGGLTERTTPPHAGLEADFDRQMTIHLAGRAAERLVFGTVSAGAGGGANSDLAQAARLSLAMDHELGLGIHGNAWFGPPDPARLTAEERKRLQEQLDHAEDCARALLYPHRHVLQEMASVLTREREFDASTINRWLKDLPRKGRTDDGPEVIGDDISNEATAFGATSG
ncbi:AAA family ATPase [Leisingera aquaemixtae]|uniref:AAA family ATPase n=1 Tax=Leisingera aquaemixtae TaxID=1396826 RepID=A0ABY5WGY7_9RHOB|nr:AAA family ATPase [Leisingera aquaemixtae]UWQ40734.1 AAA family ATPase [Leisingera aquaemixtae]